MLTSCSVMLWQKEWKIAEGKWDLCSAKSIIIIIWVEVNIWNKACEVGNVISLSGLLGLLKPLDAPYLRGVNVTSSNALSQSAQGSSSKVSLRHFILYLSTNERKKFVFQCMDSYGLWVETADGLNLSWNVHQEITLFCKEICIHNLKLCVYRQ